MKSKPKSRKEKIQERLSEVDAEMAAADELIDGPPKKKKEKPSACELYEQAREEQQLHINRPVEIWTLYRVTDAGEHKLRTFYCQDGQFTDGGVFIGKMYNRSPHAYGRYVSLAVKLPEGSYLKFEGILSYREYLNLPPEDQTPMLPYVE
tara:strand:- start:44374 stop:44823 length:450 start_codon:yes stop_codon:yes gene_type:complete